MKALVGAFNNKEKALVGAFSVIVQLHRLHVTTCYEDLGGLVMAPGPAPSHDLPLLARSQTHVVTISLIANPTIQIYELAAPPPLMWAGDGDNWNAPNSIISEYKL